MRRSFGLPVVVGLILAAGWVSFGYAQDKAAPAKKKAATPKHTVMNPADIKWGDAPPAFPPGAKMAVLQGDPSKPQMFTARIKVPDGYKVAPHWHPTTENLTVISGTFYLGTGDKMDESKATAMTAGAFGSMPAKMHHYAWTKGETEVQIHAMGPFQLTYVNPADDPQQKKM